MATLLFLGGSVGLDRDVDLKPNMLCLLDTRYDIS